MATIDYDGPDSELTGKIIGCAIEVHRHFGCGLKEEAYEIALCWELRQLDLKVERQKACPVIYKGMDLSQENERPRRIDILRALRFLRVGAAGYFPHPHYNGLREGKAIW